MNDRIDNLLSDAARFEREGNLELAGRLLERALDLEAAEASRQVASFRMEANGNLVAIYA
jgi:hypothetical protein